MKINGAPIVPHLIALAGEDFENSLTITIPRIDAIKPIEAKAKAKAKNNELKALAFGGGK